MSQEQVTMIRQPLLDPEFLLISSDYRLGYTCTQYTQSLKVNVDSKLTWYSGRKKETLAGTVGEQPSFSVFQTSQQICASVDRYAA